MPFSHNPNSGGFSLIEVLISMLVLSLGIIGAIKLQLASIQTAQQSYFYSTAVELASEMADKMRSNVDQMHYANTNPFLKVDFQSGKAGIPSAAMCYTAHCSPEQLARADIAEWLQHIDNALPHARALICRDNAPWDTGTDDLRWDCADSDDKAGVVIKLGWANQHDEGANPPPRIAVALIF